MSVSLPERFNGEAYRGINILMLWAAATAKDYSSARWMTFNQAKQLGGHVRKSEKSATVVKYGNLRQSEINQRLDVSKPVLHRTVASLLAEGLLVRSDDTEDSRAHRLALTDEGRAMLAAILPGYFETISDFMEKKP